MKRIAKLLFFLILSLVLISAPFFALAAENASCAGPQCWKIFNLPQQWRYHLTWVSVLGAAFIDSINPCEFAILILLMATFLVEGKRKQALQSGLTFVLAIFIAYFAIGMGIFKLAQGIAFVGTIKKVVGAAAIIVGILNIKDYISYGSGGFVMEVPRKWRPRMKDIVRGVTGPWGAFVAGLIVSIFLLPCTSGPYFVILGLLAEMNITFAKLLGWLLFYNVIFIIPMLVIILAMYFGLGHEKAEAWRQKKLRQLHLIAGVIMIIIGIVILLNII